MTKNGNNANNRSNSEFSINLPIDEKIQFSMKPKPGTYSTLVFSKETECCLYSQEVTRIFNAIGPFHREETSFASSGYENPFLHKNLLTESFLATEEKSCFFLMFDKSFNKFAKVFASLFIRLYRRILWEFPFVTLIICIIIRTRMIILISVVLDLFIILTWTR